MSRRIKKKNIDTQLHMRGSAKIEKWAEENLNAPDPDRSVDMSTWAGESPPHTIHGVPYEELVAQREEKEETSKLLFYQ